jgi:hypothetical protein
MTDVVDVKDSNEYDDLLKKSLEDEDLSYYKYSEFNNVQQIDDLFGSTFRAIWKDSDNVLALKPFDNQVATIKEVINEVMKKYNFF